MSDLGFVIIGGVVRWPNGDGCRTATSCESAMWHEIERLRAEVEQLKKDVRFWHENAIEYEGAMEELGIVECPECGGVGQVLPDVVRRNYNTCCPRCHGHGRIREEREDGEISRLRAEVERLREQLQLSIVHEAAMEGERNDYHDMLAAALAALALPDIENDGGPGDLVGEIKNLLHNTTALAQEVVGLQAEVDALRGARR